MLPAFLIVLAILVGVAALGDRDEPPAEATAPVGVVAKRVERLRELRFDDVPDVLRVSAQRAREEGLADLDRSYPAGRRRADEDFYVRLGLLPAGTDLREIQGAILGEQVAGYYDPRSGRLRVVDGAGTGNRVLDEMTLAHELVHALEDQVFGIDLDRAEANDDRGYAYVALVEGTATQVMIDYLDEHFERETALGGLLGGSFAASGTTPLPPFVMAAITFPYLGGQEFVGRLRRRGGWRLIDAALRTRPPDSTEQVLHVDKWLAVELPAKVRRPSDGRLGRPATTGTFGEWQTARLLETAGGNRSEAAAGWGGDAYASWPGAAAIRWSWDTRRDAREFRAALADLVAGGELVGAARVAARGGEVTLAVADDPAVAERLAASR